MTRLNLLILEGRARKADLMLAELRRAGFNPAGQRVDSESDFLVALDPSLRSGQAPSLDLILADYSLPQFDGLRALQLLHECGLDILFILVSGAVEAETLVEMMKQGAVDYVHEDRLEQLGPAVIRALGDARSQREKQQTEEGLRAREGWFKNLAEVSPVGIFRTDAGRNTTYVNPRWCEITGLPPAKSLGDGWLSAVHPEDRARLAEGWSQSVKKKLFSKAEYRFLRPDCSVIWVM